CLTPRRPPTPTLFPYTTLFRSRTPIEPDDVQLDVFRLLRQRQRADRSPSGERAPTLHPQHRAAAAAGLPADAETQVVRPTQQPEIAPRVVEPELEVALAVRNAAAHGQPVAREAARALAGGDPLQVDVADVVGGLDGIAPPPGQRESRV